MIFKKIKTIIQKIFITEIIAMAIMPLATISFVSAATLKISNISGKKNQKAYTAMKNYVCAKKTSPILKQVGCEMIKNHYQKNQNSYTDQDFTKDLCYSSKQSCVELSVNKKYNQIATTYLNQIEAEENTRLQQVPGGNDTQTDARLDPNKTESDNFFPSYSNGDDYVYPEERNRTEQTTIRTGPYVSHDPRVTKEMEDMMNNHEQKIRYFANMLISGKNFQKLNLFTDKDFADEEIVEIINLFRKEYALPPLKLSTILKNTAKNHVNYIDEAQNDLAYKSLFQDLQASDFHGESKNIPGFTGTSPLERAKALGYQMATVSEGIAFEKTTLGAIFHLLYVPLHRIQFLAKNAEEIGFYRNLGVQDEFGINYSLYTEKPVVVNVGHNQNTESLPEQLIYPKNGTTLYTYTESIDELPYPFTRNDSASYETGYVFTIINQNSGIQYDTIALDDVTEGKNVAIELDSLVRSATIHFRTIFNFPLIPGHSYRISYVDQSGKQISSNFQVASNDPTSWNTF
jgi:hypothetical protein